MLHVIATIYIADGQLQPYLTAFRELVPKVLAEPGCIEYGPTVDFDSGIQRQEPLRDNTVVVIEKWESLDALMKHLTTPHMLAYKTETKDMVVDMTLHILKEV